LWGVQPAAVVSKYLSILFIAGFPVAMYLAWTRDLGHQGRRLFGAAAIALCLIAFLSWLVPDERREATPGEPRGSPGEIRSLSVLPLDDLPAEPGREYFAAGLTDLLIAELSRLDAFKVISRKSIMHYADTTKTVPEIARELGVDAIVEGSVVRVDSHVRVTAQLIEAAVDRDPLNPGTHFDLGVYNLHCRWPEAAIRALDRTIELAPSFLHARMIRAWSVGLLGEYEEAARQCDALLNESKDSFEAMLYAGCSWVHQRAGEYDAARALVTRLLEPPEGAYVDPVMLAFACAGANDAGCALDSLEKSLRERSSNLIFLRTAPAFDSLRELPRFERIVEQMHFPSGGSQARL